MRTNRSPLNQDLNKSDQDSHEYDHKPGESNTARIANEKMKMLKDKSFDHQFNKNEMLDEVVVKAPKNYSQIKNRNGSQLMTANEAKITDETGFVPASVKDKEFRGGPNRKSALNMLGISNPLNKVGLWENIQAKRDRGEAPNKPGDPGYPTDQALRDSQ